MKHPTIVGKFSNGNTVTITIKDVTTPASPITIVNSASCTEIGSTGYFAYLPDINVDSKCYLVTMSNGSYELSGMLDSIKTPNVSEIDSQLSGVHGSGRWDRASGAGSIRKPYLVTAGGKPLADCQVWVSTDLDQDNIIAGGFTDALGYIYIYPNVPVGTTLYFWRRKVGYSFNNPDIEVM